MRDFSLVLPGLKLVSCLALSWVDELEGIDDSMLCDDTQVARKGFKLLILLETEVGTIK